VKLDWWTASETNNDLFVIERSADAMTFEVIGTVDGAGNSTSAIGYDWVDEDPLTGTSYYRLRQIDMDGQFSFSEIRIVQFSGTHAPAQAFPNPALDRITFRMTASSDSPCELRIVDAQGRTVLRTSHAVTKGTFDLEFELHDLSLGQYVGLVSGPALGGTGQIRFVRGSP
jgi:hypothetical protein